LTYALAFAKAAKLPSFLQVLALLFMWVRLPSQTAGPEDLADSSKKGRYPLVVFSHGLMGNHTAYSTFCSSLASSAGAEGCVVAAIEHTDGSSPVSVTPSRTVNLQRATRSLLEKDGGFLWRNGQMHHRVNELLALTSLLHDINSGSSAQALQQHSLESWAGRLDFSRLTVAGHSFGGGTAVASAYVCDRDERTPFHFQTVLALDSWMWPLMGDKMAVSTLRESFFPNHSDLSESSSNGKRAASFLFLNAEQYLYNPQWEAPQHTFLEECGTGGNHEVKRLEGGSSHQSFSDFPIIFGKIGGAVDALRGVLGGARAEKRAHATHTDANHQETPTDTKDYGGDVFQQKGPEGLLQDAVSLCVRFLESRQGRALPIQVQEAQGSKL
jgi:pimeloyl-ACP methyl ester carboxylesterase